MAGLNQVNQPGLVQREGFLPVGVAPADS